MGVYQFTLRKLPSNEENYLDVKVEFPNYTVSAVFAGSIYRLIGKTCWSLQLVTDSTLELRDGFYPAIVMGVPCYFRVMNERFFAIRCLGDTDG